MNPNATFLSCIIAVAALPAAALAQQTTLRAKPIVILGDDNFNATSVNAKGVIVGTLFAGITDDPSGIEIDGSKVITLPAPPSPWGGFNPRVINDSGSVLGWARNTGSLSSTDMFLLEDGAYNLDYQATLIEPGSNISTVQPLQLQLTKNLKVSFNTLVSLSGPVGTSYGKPPKFHHVPAMNRFTHINSINDAGVVGGNTYSFSGVSAVYTGFDGKFVTIAPPGARSSTGGYVNNKGALAGSYEDASGSYHGFVYQSGTYTIFDMPAAAASLSVNAINDKGRVVGSYATANGKQHGFLYNGSTVTGFGAYDQSDTVTVAIGSNGAMVLSDQIPSSEPKYLSYRVVCSGAGC